MWEAAGEEVSLLFLHVLRGMRTLSLLRVLFLMFLFVHDAGVILWFACFCFLFLRWKFGQNKFK